MIPDETFTFRLSNEEREMIKKLAKILDRNESDTVRHLIFLAAKRVIPSDILTMPDDDIDDEYRLFLKK